MNNFSIFKSITCRPWGNTIYVNTIFSSSVARINFKLPALIVSTSTNTPLKNQLPGYNINRNSSHFIIYNFDHKNVPMADIFFFLRQVTAFKTTNFYIYRIQICSEISLQILFISRCTLPKNQPSNSNMNRNSSYYISLSFRRP